MRDAFAQAVYEAVDRDRRVAMVVADISPAGAMDQLRQEYPDNFINVGVAEQAMVGMAAGMAMAGMRPICYTIATFALFRPYEFIRCDLAYQGLPVTIVGMGAGISYPTLGGTHQAIEDVAVAMAIPGMTVLCPCDPRETREMVDWCVRRDSGGPVYLRLGKAGEPDLTSGLPPWEFGRVRQLHRTRKGYVMSLVSYGPILSEVLELGRQLDWNVYEVPVLSGDDCATIDDLLDHLPHGTVVVEEASGAPLQKLLRARTMSQEWLEMKSVCIEGFPHVNGTRQDLLEHCGLTASRIRERTGY